MKTLCPLVLGAALCLLLTSCVTESVNPLASPDAAQADPRLVGDWRGGTDSDRNTCRFTITKAPWMHVEIIPDRPEDKPRPDELPQSYDFFPTVIGKETFLNVVMVGKDDKDHPTKAYLFLRYKFSGKNILHLWMMSQELPAAAIHAGKLKGLLIDSDVSLQDTGANIVKFIQNSNLDDLFKDKLNGFDRVMPAGK